MISIYNIKPKFQKLLQPFLLILHKWGVTANQITLTSVFLSLVIGVGFWFAIDNRLLFLVLPFGLLFRMALNALDGMMARTYNMQSKKGEILNELGDTISDFFIFFPLLIHEKENLYLIVIFICLSIINEFSGILGKTVSNNRRYDGPMGKSDRAFIMALYGIVSFLAINISKYSFWVFIIINILLIVSTYTRCKKSLQQ